MITVATCFDLSEANRLRMALESQGIAAFIPDELSASALPHLFMTGSGIRLQVAEEDSPAARRIIEEERQERS